MVQKTKQKKCVCMRDSEHKRKTERGDKTNEIKY